jgi:hypothetical protein
MSWGFLLSLAPMAEITPAAIIAMVRTFPGGRLTSVTRFRDHPGG